MSASIPKYGFAVTFALIAVLLTALLWPYLAETPFVIVIGAVILSASRGGFGPGMLTAIIGVLSVKYFLIEPRYEIIASFNDVIQLIFFLLLTLFISGLEENRNQTERALRQVKDELETILNGVAEGITAQDINGKVVFANSASALITNQPSRTTMIETRLEKLQEAFEIFDENGKPLPYTAMPRHQVFANGAPSELVFQQHIIGSDSRRWIRLKSTPVFDDKGKVRLAVNIFRDVTERRELAIARQETEKRLRKVLDNMAIFVAVLTPEGNVIEVNRPALEATRLKAEDIIGKRLDALKPLAYSDEIQQRIHHSIQSAAAGQTIRFDTRALLAEDHFITVDFMLAPVYADDGTIQYLIASGIDITERHRREQEILNLTILTESQRRRLDLIIANVPGIVYETTGTLEDNTRTDFISGYVEKLLGYSPEEWEKDSDFWQKITHPDDRESAIKQARDIFYSGRPGAMQFRCIAKDGRTVHIEAQSSMLKDKDDKYLGFCGVMTDITERKQHEESLMKYAQELTRSNEELSQFAYVASHDLQEPLRMVTSYLQMIEQRYKDKLDADGIEFINYSVDGAARMKVLINDLLAYSRLDRARTPFQQVDMDTSLLMAIHHLQLTIDDTKATITHDPMPEITANDSHMIQLMQNLIGNALKFHSEAAPQIHVGCKREGDDWLFSVRDNGIGIEAEYLERIFVIFQRLHPRERYPGTGIGLAICKKIVETHDGRIWAESQPGIGTTFYFTIPVKHRKRIRLNAEHESR